MPLQPSAPPPACVHVASRTSLAAFSGRRIGSLMVVTQAPPALTGHGTPVDRIHVRTREGTVRRLLLLVAGDTVDTLRVAESPASIECRLHSLVELGTSTMVLGTVLAVTVWETALDGDHPTMAALEPLSRLGRNEWGLPPEVFALDRPARPEDVDLG